MSSLKQLDKDLRQLSINDLLILNQIGEKKELENDAKATLLRAIFIYGFIVFTITLLTFENILLDYILFGLTLTTMSMGLWTFKRGEHYTMIGISGITGLWSIYYLILSNILIEQISVQNIAIGCILLILSLSYIKTANQYSELEQKTNHSLLKDLYSETYQLLNSSSPNASNNLIDLKAIQEKITIWLRSSTVVILSRGKTRLFFDVSKSFKIEIQGKDNGGDTIRVNANIINRLRFCWISRHAWLRYLQFKQ